MPQPLHWSRHGRSCPRSGPDLGDSRRLSSPSGDEATAPGEARQENLRQGVPPRMVLPLLLAEIEVDLEPILDPTDGRVRRSLPRRMLGEPWWLLQDQHHEAFTRGPGRLARDHGFVALLVPSAARPRGTNVVIYLDRIAHRGGHRDQTGKVTGNVALRTAPPGLEWIGILDPMGGPSGNHQAAS